MKLLIFAGPYEAARIRKSAMAAGFEAIIVEPGESLSAWISAIHPDGIVVVPQSVGRDPTAVVAKIRAVPRGRVPIFLVGDAEDEDRLRPLANGFLGRPITPEGLGACVRETFGSVQSSLAESAGPSRPAGRDASIFDALGDSIDADFDAEIRDVVRAVGAMKPPTVTGSPAANVPPTGSVPTPSPTPSLPPSPSPSQSEVELDLPSLLARMFLSRLSGRLTLTHGNQTKHIIFEDGQPVLAGSALPEDRMGEMLVRQGRVSAEQMSSCSVEVTSGRRLGGVLVDRGLVKATELGPLVRHHFEDVMYSLFNWDHGTWNLGTDASAAVENIRLSQHPAALILEGIRRAYTAERALAGLGGKHRVLRLRLTTGASELLENMGISAEERNLVLLFDGLRGLDEIQSLTGAPPDRLYGVAWALYVLERLDPVDGPGRVAEASGPMRGRSPSPVGRDRAADRALLESRYAVIVDGDYFQILGVSRDASAAEIRRGYEVRMAELAPEAVHPTVAAEWEPELVEMRTVLAEASRLLGDERLRDRYRDHLPPLGSMRATRSGVGAESARS